MNLKIYQQKEVFQQISELSLLVAAKEMSQWEEKVYEICKRCFLRFQAALLGQFSRYCKIIGSHNSPAKKNSINFS